MEEHFITAYFYLIHYTSCIKKYYLVSIHPEHVDACRSNDHGEKYRRHVETELAFWGADLIVRSIRLDIGYFYIRAH